jgi:hypothetical protein
VATTVWPRDLVETQVPVAAGDFEGARRATLARNRAGGGRHWPQNCWLDGAPIDRRANTNAPSLSSTEDAKVVVPMLIVPFAAVVC